MRIEFDEAKRQRTLDERGLDFEDAPRIFEGPHFDLEDDRREYNETRFITYGRLKDRPVMLVWTLRDKARRIISLRYANDREREIFWEFLGGS